MPNETIRGNIRFAKEYVNEEITLDNYLHSRGGYRNFSEAIYLSHDVLLWNRLLQKLPRALRARVAKDALALTKDEIQLMLTKTGSSTYDAFFKYDPNSQKNVIEFDNITLLQISIILDLPYAFTVKNDLKTFPKEQFVEYHTLINEVTPMISIKDEIHRLHDSKDPKCNRIIGGIIVKNEDFIFPCDEPIVFSRIDVKKGEYIKVAFYVKSDLIMSNTQIIRIKNQLNADIAISIPATLRTPYRKLKFITTDSSKTGTLWIEQLLRNKQAIRFS
ncbi:UNVERIFIED_CONTAM: hypothetical protein ABID98_001891 [Brevibacillus sp. OAP136]